jgi:hypothetical protein
MKMMAQSQTLVSKHAEYTLHVFIYDSNCVLLALIQYDMKSIRNKKKEGTKIGVL